MTITTNSPWEIRIVGEDTLGKKQKVKKQAKKKPQVDVVGKKGGKRK